MMESLTWECADIILEEALGLSSLGHEPGEGPLHVPPLGSRLFPQHLVVGHGLPVGLEQGKKGMEQLHFQISHGWRSCRLCSSVSTGFWRVTEVRQPEIQGFCAGKGLGEGNGMDQGVDNGMGHGF